jgi:hypothetical protein
VHLHLCWLLIYCALNCINQYYCFLQFRFRTVPWSDNKSDISKIICEISEGLALSCHHHQPQSYNDVLIDVIERLSSPTWRKTPVGCPITFRIRQLLKKKFQLFMFTKEFWARMSSGGKAPRCDLLMKAMKARASPPVARKRRHRAMMSTNGRAPKRVITSDDSSESEGGKAWSFD